MIEGCEKTCNNCKYFKRYYFISTNLAFCPTKKGFCANYNIKDKISAMHILRNENCDLWQPYELEKLARQYKIESLLIRATKNIEDILILLRNTD